VSSQGLPAKAARSELLTDRHEVGTHPSQTRAPNPASVSAEGGGIVTPTLGGGFGFSREQEAAEARGEGRPG
jgi:hypothetical protein